MFTSNHHRIQPMEHIYTHLQIGYPLENLSQSLLPPASRACTLHWILPAHELGNTILKLCHSPYRTSFGQCSTCFIWKVEIACQQKKTNGYTELGKAISHIWWFPGDFSYSLGKSFHGDHRSGGFLVSCQEYATLGFRTPSLWMWSSYSVCGNHIFHSTWPRVRLIMVIERRPDSNMLAEV